MVELEERLVSAVVGSLVADAAVQPAHWCYDAMLLRAALKEQDALSSPTFLPTSVNRFYTLPTGRQSCYGDQTWVLLQSLLAHGGLSPVAYSRSVAEFFGDGGIYGPYPSEHLPREKLPQALPWRTTSIRLFLNKVLENPSDSDSKWLFSGAPDDQMEGVVRVAPVVALYFGREDLLERVRAAVQVTQSSEMSQCCSLAAARILSGLLEGKTRQESVKDTILEMVREGHADASPHDREVAEKLSLAMGMADLEHAEVVAELGKGCGVPFCLQNAVHAVVKYDTLTEAVTATLLAGGDSAARACFIGACFGAEAPGLIPADWLAATETPVRDAAERLVREVRQQIT